MRRMILLTLYALLILPASSALAYNSPSLVEYNQTDSRWANKPFGGVPGNPKMKSSACGAAALAMVGATLLHDRSIDPPQVAWKNRGVVSNQRLSNNDKKVSWFLPGAYDKVLRAGHSLGLHTRRVGRDLDAVRTVLDRGGLAIALMQAGHFTGGGHFVVIHRATSRGFYVSDPYGKGQFGFNNENRPFSGKFLLQRGTIYQLWTFEHQ